MADGSTNRGVCLLYYLPHSCAYVCYRTPLEIVLQADHEDLLVVRFYFFVQLAGLV